MPKIQVNKNKYFTVMSNYHLNDKRISLKAVGLMSKMLSLPDDWDYSINGLAAICKEGVKSIRAALQELEDAGYLVRTRIQDEKGHFDYIYDIYEEPQKNVNEPYTQKGHAVEPYTQKGHAEKGHTQKGTQLNTNKQNTKELNTNDLKKEEKEKEQLAFNDSNNVTTQLLNVTHCYTEKEAQQIVTLYNDTCVSLPSIKILTDKRKKAIKTRLKKYSLSDIQKVFSIAEASDFLKGNNDRGWRADFDWLLNESNMVKVLEGNYSNNRVSKNDWNKVNSSSRDKQYDEFEQRLFNFGSNEGIDTQ